MKTKSTILALNLTLFTLAAAWRLEAQSAAQFVTIYHFGGINAIPGAGLTAGSGGKLFGTTYGGAASDGTGSIYELVPNGNGSFAFNTLYRFDTAYSPPNDGQYPYAGLTLSADGTTLYGTTQQGGTGGGVIFSLNIAQSEGAVVKAGLPHPKDSSSGYNISHEQATASEGSKSIAELMLAGNVDAQIAQLLFGVSSSDGPDGGGTIYSFDPASGTEKTMHAFSGSGTANAVNGFDPQGKLALAKSGGGLSGSVQKTPIKPNAATNIDLSTIAVYGVTTSGGSNNWGTVYSIRADGSNFMTLHDFSFSTSDGTGPMGGLVLSGNTLYGTTTGGGSNYAGTVFSINTNGSGFQIIKNFDFATTGYSPQGDLILSGDTLYGTTYSGGAGGGGTVYSINTSGSNFMVLHSFTTPTADANGNYTNSDGGWSVAGLLLSGYTLYGTTPYGGTNGVGTAYEILLPAPPLLNIARAGSEYKISWPSSATNFVLQQNSNLATTNWSTNPLAISNDGTNRSITIPPPSGQLFFRLISTNGP